MGSKWGTDQRILVVEGLMRVYGYNLGPGDYASGWDEEHGPLEYPEGCVVFTVYHGPSVAHEY